MLVVMMVVMMVALVLVMLRYFSMMLPDYFQVADSSKSEGI